MKEKALRPVNFRPTRINQERLEYASKLGCVVSDLVNEVLEKHLRTFVEREKERRLPKLREALNAPVP